MVIWQYILFNHNDSDEELIQWQKMALDAGVNRLRFVFTRCNNYSTRQTGEDIPRIFPDIDVLPINQYSNIGLEEARRSLGRNRNPSPGPGSMGRVQAGH